MFDFFLFFAFVIWATVKIIAWVFNALLGILPPSLAEGIRTWTRFAIAILIVWIVLCEVFS